MHVPSCLTDYVLGIHLESFPVNQATCWTCFSSVVTLAQPSVSSSLQITNHCFRYASPYLWNMLPSSFRQPHSVHCPPGSHHLACITFSHFPPSLSPSVTASAFHSRLKSVPQSISSIVFLVPFGLPSWILDLDTLTGHWSLFVLVSSFTSFCFWFCVLDEADHPVSFLFHI